MFKREVQPRVPSSLTRRETRILIYNGVESDSGGFVTYSERLISDDLTAKRKKPQLPSLFPTDLRRCRISAHWGSLDTAPYKRSGGTMIDVNADLRWNQTSGRDAWALMPGLTATRAGYVTLTRSIDQEILCHNALLERIKNSTMNIPLAILEARKTASWITSRAVSISHVINKMKGKSKWERFRKAVNSLGGQPPKTIVLSDGRYGYRPVKQVLYKNPNRLPPDPPNGWSSMDVADRWLEVQYALKPFLKDVEGGAKALASFLDERKLTYLSTWESQAWVRNQTNVFTTNYSWYTGKVSHDVESVTRYRIKVNYLLDVYFAAFVQSSFTNIPETAWEVVPYSFVVDWGASFGDYLALLDATVPCKFLSGTTSLSLIGATISTNAAHEKSIAAQAVHIDVPTVSAKCYTRNVLGGFPLPGVVVKSPVSPSHVASSLALIRKTFSR